MNFSPCRRLDCSSYGAVNSVRLVSTDSAPSHLLSGHDDGQLLVFRISSSGSSREAEVALAAVIAASTNILWCIDLSPGLVVSCSEDRTIAVYRRGKILRPPQPELSLRESQDMATRLQVGTWKQSHSPYLQLLNE